MYTEKNTGAYPLSRWEIFPNYDLKQNIIYKINFPPVLIRICLHFFWLFLLKSGVNFSKLNLKILVNRISNINYIQNWLSMQKSKKTYLKNMCSPIKYNFLILYYSCKKHFLCPLQSPRNSFHFHFHIFSLQIQRFLHDILLDQLSPLVELKFWLAKLAVSNPPVNTRCPLLLEVVPQVISNQNCDNLLLSVYI